MDQAAGVTIAGYCLMTNHVHLVALPSTEAALAAAIGRTHYLVTQYINRQHGRSGHRWQKRFYSCGLVEPHRWTTLRYVERNPVRAGLVRAPWRYPWSSAAAHVGDQPDASGLLDLAEWAATWKPERWRALLQEPLEQQETTRLRHHLHTGRPLASDSFLSKLEIKLGRRLRPLPRGRPKKERKK